MDRVPDGILKMLKDLEDYIVSAGLADMMASADIITQVKFEFILIYLLYGLWYIMLWRLILFNNRQHYLPTVWIVLKSVFDSFHTYTFSACTIL